MKNECLNSYYEKEGKHWWFYGRKQILLNSFHNFLKGSKNLKILDIGSGTGDITINLEKYGNVVGLEQSYGINKFWKGNSSNLVIASFPFETPFKNSDFNVITMLDVVEHIEDDFNAFVNIYKLLKVGGYFFCSVPALKFLWSEHDIVSGHIRRYKKNELKRKLKSVGFKIIYIKYYEFLLFLPVLFIRLLNKLKLTRTEFETKKHLPNFFNNIIAKFFALEKYLIYRFSFPIGVCLLAVAKKEN